MATIPAPDDPLTLKLATENKKLLADLTNKFETGHLGVGKCQQISLFLWSLICFGLAIGGHVGNNCITYSEELYSITTALFCTAYVLIMGNIAIYNHWKKFCKTTQDRSIQMENRMDLEVAAFASMAGALLAYDAFTVTLSTYIGFAAFSQSIITMMLFSSILMHGHSPKCLKHEADETISTVDGRCSPGKQKLRSVTSIMLIVFVILYLTLIGLIIGFNYTLYNRGARPTQVEGCTAF